MVQHTLGMHQEQAVKIKQTTGIIMSPQIQQEVDEKTIRSQTMLPKK